MATKHQEWSNATVLEFADGEDPIRAVRRKAQALVFSAMERGWHGPPFDPFELASLLEINLVANASIKDALLRRVKNKNQIEFNPNRHISRLKFSIAHEISHTFFPNYFLKTQYRGKDGYSDDDWQLEALCNIAAAELLMPIGSDRIEFEDFPEIERIMELRREYEVSSEAILIHVSKLIDIPCAAFCASRVRPNDPRSPFQMNYLMGNHFWSDRVRSGTVLPEDSILSRCNGIGFTIKGNERWESLSSTRHIEAVGLPPYPGTASPRVAGLIFGKSSAKHKRRSINYLHGDASSPPVGAPAVIAHIVNDKARRWGGRGFAAALSRHYSDCYAEYSNWSENASLGDVHVCEAGSELAVASMVAQKGYGQSKTPRIQYQALEVCLHKLQKTCESSEASLHIPRIGTGQAGGNWKVIEGMIDEILISNGTDVTVYDIPPKN